MREEKAHSIFLPVLFGVLGLIVLMLAWLWPVSASDRITAIVVGSAGIFGALLRIPILKRPLGKPDSKQSPVNVEVEEKP
jgi:hypothetical protein